MKKALRTLCMAAAVTCCMAFPAMAAETKAEYKEEVAPVKSEIKELEAQAKPLRQENKRVAAAYKSIRLNKKNTGTLSISKDNWKKAKELHKEIAAIRAEYKPAGETTKVIRAHIKEAVKNKDFDTALNGMNQILERKKASLERLEKTNEIWAQIDELLD